MKVQIQATNRETGGLITGDNSDWPSGLPLMPGLRVIFKAQGQSYRGDIKNIEVNLSMPAFPPTLILDEVDPA